MSEITELRLRDIRCFDGEQSAKLGRVTLLVGENSSGKSTFLGCYNAFATLANFYDLDDENYFDDSPFHMGYFNTIVRADRTDFSVGGSFKNHLYTNAEFTFLEGNNRKPFESKLELEFNDSVNSKRRLSVSAEPESDTLRFDGPNFHFNLRKTEVSYASISTWISRYVRRGFLPYRGDQQRYRDRKESKLSGVEEFVKFINFLESGLPLPNSPTFKTNALDPSLPRRKRIYEAPPEFAMNFEPSANQEVNLAKLRLWNNIEAQRTNDRKSFEVKVETAAGAHNLIDVGYGIHSLLPLARELQVAEPKTVFLLQQPEIHLHPAIQAELAQLMAESDFSFIIETHSDQFIDRFRICVMEKVLQPEDLTILYFETDSCKTKSNIFSIEVDELANFVNAPNGYRKFFMEETKRLMGL